MGQATDVFRGGVAVVTGAGSGIGEGLARTAAELGMQVALADVNVERMERVAAEIRATGATAITIPTDVADPAAIDRLAATVHDRLGDVRLLMNNAGIEILGLTWELPTDVWEKAIRINVLGVIHGVRAFVPRMLAAGKPAFIGNLSSIGGLSMMAVQTPYILSKHAVLSFSECLRMEMDLVGAPISVSAVLPGPIATRIFEDAATPKDSTRIEFHRKMMQDMTHGPGSLTGKQAAERILAGIAAKEFFVSTHPEITAQMAKQRAEHLATLSTPTLGEEAKRMLLG
ncbi:MAG: SDR family NAD(P)-dependent oxidoreductase [Deltaproteobacteria bacterium]|nr:SDR family NAD(P)-dependent oxidoreductase [Deltaproteobacteria bacterium]